MSESPTPIAWDNTIISPKHHMNMFIYAQATEYRLVAQQRALERERKLNDDASVKRRQRSAELARVQQRFYEATQAVSRARLALEQVEIMHS